VGVPVEEVGVPGHGIFGNAMLAWYLMGLDGSDSAGFGVGFDGGVSICDCGYDGDEVDQ
jgi:hypothetical protein